MGCRMAWFVASCLGHRVVLLGTGLIVLLAMHGRVLADARPAIGRTLVDILEQRFERAQVQDWAKVTGIVVPGGTPTRTVEAMRLARLHPHLKIVLNGPNWQEMRVVEAATDIDRSRIVIETWSTNTFGNAYFGKQVVDPAPGEQWLLVTSAAHMPRAIGSFHGVGFDIAPWPVVDTQSFAPGALLHIARHEWVGLLAYWLRGRTIALFPGPSDLRRASVRFHPAGITMGLAPRAP